MIPNLPYFDKVIAVEANPSLYKEARRRWESDPRIEILHYAVSDKDGFISFYISNADTISTTSLDWIKNSRFSQSHIWYQPIDVPAITLDGLIKAFGVPDLIKLDIEDAELDAVRGLSQKVPEIMWEWAEESQDKINKTVGHLKGLGFTKFGFVDCDDYLARPQKFVSWEELKFNDDINKGRKERWGMLHAR